ncbi:AraC family transcriptional regulator [Anaerocolumna cellulosilytica]|uniref:AraC family transcriptional regulator n=1 Tax=Anaerocolumna cellulosilytica TaxID=433286 RepID=A0A6S6R5J9_9FIRM|nr:AraC family transcriptional regulator [Anaerocolumna cellulosilytica]MBB5194710.1 AraC-like DNA-binding protein [Anaerocolumna cellulosilytica]BCJ94328.1 AraC family transcriptional regulator [Anaerocolumna cellulosilytica]
MKSKENGILNQSDIYFYTPSTQAQKIFLYPLCTGHYYYSPDYRLERNSYDSFLLMFILKGSCTIGTNEMTAAVTENQIAFLDCYQPHSYFTKTGWEALWIHFDGVLAREYYDLIHSSLGNVITLKSNYLFLKILTLLFENFHQNSNLKEPLLSQYIITLLTQLLLSQGEYETEIRNSNIVDEIVSFIHKNLSSPLSLDFLAKKASLSPYYFLRLFKDNTGFTPHEYILLSRINLAKFTLKTTDMSVKEIGLHCGFSSESSFCTAFKKSVQMTPSVYRNTSVN